MQARLASETPRRVGNKRRQYKATIESEQSYPTINPALLLPRLSEDCKQQLERNRKAIPHFDARQWAMVERFLIEQGVAPSFTGELNVECIQASYENLLTYIASAQKSSQDSGELEYDVTFEQAPFNANLEIKIERYGFAFLDLSTLYDRFGSTFVKALSLIDIVLHDIVPSEFYCEYSGHFWPLNECSDEAFKHGRDAVYEEVKAFEEDEYEESDLDSMYERMVLLKGRGEQLMKAWCSTQNVFEVLEEVEEACSIKGDYPVAKWCLNVAKTIRNEFQSSGNWQSWYNNRLEVYNDGCAPIVALFNDWDNEHSAYQMAFEMGETGTTYSVSSEQDISSLKRVCELRTLGGQLLQEAVELSDQLTD